MNDRYDYLYNRIVDVSAVIHIFVKLFAMFVVIKYTPKDHRYHSYFILNIMIWNLLGNLLFTFAHINPLYPAECFRLDGFISHFIDNESVGQAVFFAEYACLIQCAVAVGLAFPYRFIVFAYPDFAPKPARVVMLCSVVQVLVGFLSFPLSMRWLVRYDDYPEKSELPAREFVFCMYPHGFRKIAAISTHLILVFLFSTVISVFSVLFLWKLRNEKHAYHPQTIALQKKLFVSLVIITAIAFIFGGMPSLISVIMACFPHVPYARYMVMLSYVFLVNHGTIYSVAYLTLFKAYRDAVRRCLFKIIGKDEQWKTKINCINSNLIVT